MNTRNKPKTSILMAVNPDTAKPGDNNWGRKDLHCKMIRLANFISAK